MKSEFRSTSPHSVEVSGGRMVRTGETCELDTKKLSPHDAGLIEDGVLIPVADKAAEAAPKQAPKKAAEAAPGGGADGATLTDVNGNGNGEGKGA